MGTPPLRNINELYDEGIVNGTEEAEQFWGKLPKDFSAIGSLCDLMDTDRDVDRLIQILREFHKEKGIYSKRVERNLQSIRNGSILGGQQPIVLGGPSFIGNKIAALVFTSEIMEKEGRNFAPVFMIGSYDGLQKELIRSYFPNPISPNATLLDLETDQLPNTIADKIELPGSEWFESIISHLEESFRGFRKRVKGAQQKLVDERFDHIITLLSLVYRQSTSFTDMFIRMWGTIANVVNDFGIVFLPTSHEDLKDFYLAPYLHFLDRIETYTEKFNEMTRKIEEMGYNPSLPNRSLKYSPFYLICKCDIRINPDIKKEGDSRIAHAHCKECGNVVNVPVNKIDDLKKISSRLAPRVDTSQLVLQDILNVKVRISGPGEIAYYAQVAPSIRAIGVRTPVFVKYKRLFYNTPWNEKLGKLIAGRKQGSLHSERMFNSLKRRIHALKTDDKDEVHLAELEINSTIREEYNKLLTKAGKHDPAVYLSWQFGRFTPEKFGQEVSWIWIDMALQTGLNDYLQTYYRMYTTHSIPGTAYFTNTNL